MSAARNRPRSGAGRAGGHGPAWVAGAVRARSLARRRLGGGAARELAARPALEDAVAALAATPYRHGVRPGQDLVAAQRGVAVTLLWHLRVLAGWLPRPGAAMLRLLAGWFEIANVDELLQRMAGDPAEEPVGLGSLATAWPRCAQARSPPSCGAVLAASPWGDPGGETRRDVQLGMRLSWAARLARVGPAAPVGGGRGRAAGGPRTVRGRHGSSQRRCGAGTLAAGRRRPGRHLPGRAGAAPSRPRPLGPCGGRGPGGPVAGGGWLVVPGRAGRLRAARRLRPGRGRPCSAPWPSWPPTPGGSGAALELAARGGAAPGGVRCPGVNGCCRCGCSGWRWSRPATPCGRCWSRVADAGTVELDAWTTAEEAVAARAAATAGCSGCRRAGAVAPALSPARARPRARCERAGRWDLLAGRGGAGGAGPRRGRPRQRGRARRLGHRRAVPGLAARLAEVGGAVVPLPRPRGVDPPTLLRASRPAPLARPRWWRPTGPCRTPTSTRPCSPAVAYVVMFGMMFGDVGHGALLLLAAAAAARGAAAPAGRASAAPGRSSPAPGWPASLRAAVRRVLRPDRGRAGAVAGAAGGAGHAAGWPRSRVGAVLLAGAYALGTVNRWREGGWPLALYAPSGVAGAAVFLGARPDAPGAGGSGWRVADGRRRGRGGGRARPGLRRVRGRRPAGGGAGAAQAASSCSTWWCGSAPTSCPSPGWPRSGSPTPRSARSSGTAPPGCGTAARRRGAAAVLVFVVGNALAFALEALVAGRAGAAAGVLRAVLPGVPGPRAGRSGPGTSRSTSEDGVPCRSG